MAQRKSPPTKASKSSSRPGSPGSSGSRPGSSGGAKVGGSKSAQANLKKVGGSRPGGGRSSSGKSIVNQKQTPWGLIAVTTAVVLFAAAIVIVVIATHKSSKSEASATNTSGCSTMVDAPGQTGALNGTSYLNELKCAKAIKGVTFKPEANRNHVTTIVKYDSSPPVGGNHNQYWANCTGVVYSTQLANENAVHMLEHGAIWITYNPKTLSDSQLTKLETYVKGIDRMALTPYAGLKTPISLQAWGYQLFLQKATDPRIAQFIKDLRYNTKTTPEYGASCSDPYFDAAQSYPGHPQNTPKTT